MRTPLFALSVTLLTLLTLPAFAGGGGEEAVLIVDPTNPESLHVANHYRAARNLPPGNVLYLAPGAASYATQAAVNVEGFLGALANRRLEDHIDQVILTSGGSFFVPASGLVSDGCFPVNRFATPLAYTMARQSSRILASNLNSTDANGFYANGWTARAFDASQAWLGGVPSGDQSARRYFIATMLGYTGANANTRAEVLAMIDRSVAADGTAPAGTFYFMQTTDPARSGPRHGDYPEALTRLASLGGVGAHLFDVLPSGASDALGVMTGWATPDILGANFTLLPGSFADHLTSYAATFDDVSQTKMALWITKGASGTAGTVEEPCNYPAKFPSARLHVAYRSGLTLGEAWFRSLAGVPFQGLFTGDPLTRPFAELPSVSVPDLPAGPVAGALTIHPSASATAAGASIAGLELLIDGVRVDARPAGSAFTLQTSTLAEGWHDLRVLATDSTLVANVGRFVGALEVDNTPFAVTLTPTITSGDLSSEFSFTLSASGASVSELRLLHNGRVVASSAGSFAVLGLFGQNFGAGPVLVQAEARASDGKLARSAPLTLTIADSSSTPTSTPPVAYSFTRRVLRDAPFLLELPARFDDALASASHALLTSPAQSTMLGGTGTPWRVFRAAANALGSDTLTFQVTTPGGVSNVATVTLEYHAVSTATPYGCLNPPDSLRVLAGEPRLGSTLVLGVDNPNGTQSVGSLPYLFFARNPAPGYPCGTSLPGFGMGAPGSTGEFLIDLSPAARLGRLIGGPWAGAGQPVAISLPIPTDLAYLGLHVYAQAAMFDPLHTTGNRFGMSSALDLTVGN
ncbi:MAG: TIGR03790 family protein [Planctomycetota bacterium]